MTLDPVVAAQILVSPEFRNANGNCVHAGCAASGGPTGNQSQAYELHNLHEALSSGLTGTGQMVAVVDDGFRVSHQELSGKTIQQWGALPVSDHGTHVASLVAGKKDGVGMHGVAPGASLHLTALNPTGAAAFDIGNVTQGTLHASSLGAVAQNNSWGFPLPASTMQAHLAANPGQTVAQGLNALIANYGVTRWQGYLDALNGFQDGGVVVWALSNDNSIASGDVMAALPVFDSRLQGAWIAAANGYFEVDATGDISRAIRLSAPCGLTARFCIAGDGTTTAANAASDSGYSAGTGTSYVAPQIAGAVALLAEAFPDLTAEEWGKRLLASADNRWFSALSIPVAGSVDFGNGVTHAYSEEWGHGVLDIAAALSPIGTLAVLSGDDVVTSERVSLAESTLVTPAPFGDGLASALAGNDIAVFDSLNRGFAVQGSDLVAAPRHAMLPDLMAAVAGPHLGVLPSYAAVQEKTPAGGAASTSIALLSSASGVFETEGSGSLNARASVFSTARDAVAMVSTQHAGPVAITAVGLVGEGAARQQNGVAGAGLKLGLESQGSRVAMGLSFMGEEGSLLGLGRNAAFDLGSGSAAGTAHLGVDQIIAPGLELFGRLEYGVARPAGAAAGMVIAMSDIHFSGFEVGARMAGVLHDNDALGFSVSQPLRIETGTMGLALPVSRGADGVIEHRQVHADLAPGGREVDLSLNYEVPVQAGQLQIGLQYRIDAGHVQGSTAAGAALGFRQSF
ncbi:MAG TPA: S8 family peptidase [Devosia sp.]|nr:S8 family peptidase [Devosia sp.]